MDTRRLILEADSIASRKGLKQCEWSRLAGYAKNGQTISRIMSRGNCKLNTFVSLLDSIGCEIKIVEREEEL